MKQGNQTTLRIQRIFSFILVNKKSLHWVPRWGERQRDRERGGGGGEQDEEKLWRWTK